MSITKIDCACVIYGNKYHPVYIERLYNQLCRAFSVPVTLHVLTEASRKVNSPYVKHDLVDWNIKHSKLAWWYKLQLFNPEFFSGPVLYFDLDVVIVNSLDWIFSLPQDYFWSIKDFRHLWRPASTLMNSSMMYWSADKYHQIYTDLTLAKLDKLMSIHRGDQEYLSTIIQPPALRFFGLDRVISWRWQAQEGGYDFSTRAHRKPGYPAVVSKDTSVIVFHGDPKPHEVADPLIVKHWC